MDPDPQMENQEFRTPLQTGNGEEKRSILVNMKTQMGLQLFKFVKYGIVHVGNYHEYAHFLIHLSKIPISMFGMKKRMIRIWILVTKKFRIRVYPDPDRDHWQNHPKMVPVVYGTDSFQKEFFRFVMEHLDISKDIQNIESNIRVCIKTIRIQNIGAVGTGYLGT